MEDKLTKFRKPIFNKGVLNKIKSGLLCMVKWSSWFVNYALVWPATTLLFSFIFMLKLGHTTPGTLMVHEISAATYKVGAGDFRISQCSNILEPVATFRCERNVITDARGYASRIDHSFESLLDVWVNLAAVFLLISIFFRLSASNRFSYTPKNTYGSFSVKTGTRKLGGGDE